MTLNSKNNNLFHNVINDSDDEKSNNINLYSYRDSHRENDIIQENFKKM